MESNSINNPHTQNNYPIPGTASTRNLNMLRNQTHFRPQIPQHNLHNPFHLPQLNTTSLAFSADDSSEHVQSNKTQGFHSNPSSTISNNSANINPHAIQNLSQPTSSWIRAPHQPFTDKSAKNTVGSQHETLSFVARPPPLNNISADSLAGLHSYQNNYPPHIQTFHTNSNQHFVSHSPNPKYRMPSNDKSSSSSTSISIPTKATSSFSLSSNSNTTSNITSNNKITKENPPSSHVNGSLDGFLPSNSTNPFSITSHDSIPVPNNSPINSTHPLILPSQSQVSSSPPVSSSPSYHSSSNLYSQFNPYQFITPSYQSVQQLHQSTPSFHPNLPPFNLHQPNPYTRFDLQRVSSNIDTIHTPPTAPSPSPNLSVTNGPLPSHTTIANHPIINLNVSAQATSFDINEKGRERLHNDYNQHFVDTGERPQNFVRDAEETKRFEEYPKLEKLMQLKREVVQNRSTPPQYMSVDLKTFDLTSLGTLFDVILVDPPWLEYSERVWGGFSTSEDLKPWDLDEIMTLKVDQIADTPSFCFLWCGVTHLEEARLVLNKWGFRRCEDICWLKTNIKTSNSRRKYEKDNPGIFRDGWKQSRTSTVVHDNYSLFQRTKEHCLVGIRGTVRRSQDTHFIHANLDTDVIIDEEPSELGSTEKPKELYDLIERFCLGRRRLELFGTDRNLRNGWITIGKSITFNNFDSSLYTSWFQGDLAWPETQDFKGGRYTGTTTEIEMLRPKSPSRTAKADESNPSDS